MKTLDQAMYEAVSTVSPAEVGEAVERVRAEYPGLTKEQYNAAIESAISLLEAELRELAADIEAYRRLKLEVDAVTER